MHTNVQESAHLADVNNAQGEFCIPTKQTWGKYLKFMSFSKFHFLAQPPHTWGDLLWIRGVSSQMETETQ